MTRPSFCIHGHFYQPPRENPWLEQIEPQPSALPYADWNERITAECYRPNGSARIVDGTGAIIDIVNNYELMSFNVGPTLMTWFQRQAPDVHQIILDADRASRARFGGHGSAMAQAYNHMILPLASGRDKVTQVRWGIADFRHRFGREPEGMWLAECAVDTATLEVLAAEGIAFTVLSPSQAAAVQAPGGDWHGGAISPGRAYRCPLPSGRSIDLFFYDGATAQAVAFERLLADGSRIVDRMIGGAPDGVGEAYLCHIATDGETYGHHHRYGDMALAWALMSVAAGRARLTNYAEFRATHPATWNVRIHEPSAWSCVHGVARWAMDCGCNSGGEPGWNQQWRRPLRDALDQLRSHVEWFMDGAARALFRDPWAARDGYVEVVLAVGDGAAGDGDAAREQFFAAHLHAPTDAAARRRALAAMEMCRHALLMYTSCGWFFDDISGIETVQILQYAARALELLEQVAGLDPALDVQGQILRTLALAPSNLASEGDGASVWRRRVEPARIGLTRVAAHVAVTELIDQSALRGPADAGAAAALGQFRVTLLDRMERRVGRIRLVAATVRVVSSLTGDELVMAFAGLHLGEHHVVGGLRPPVEAAAWAHILEELSASFRSGDVFAAQRAIDRHFADHPLSLSSILPSHRQVIARLLAPSIEEAEAGFASIYDDQAPLIRWLVEHALPVPASLSTAATIALRHQLTHALRATPPSFTTIRMIMDEAVHAGVSLDTAEIALAAVDALGWLLDAVIAGDGSVATLDSAARGAEVVAGMKSPTDLWRVQNRTWHVLTDVAPGWVEAAEAGDGLARRRLSALARLAAVLRLAVPPALREAMGPEPTAAG